MDHSVWAAVVRAAAADVDRVAEAAAAVVVPVAPDALAPAEPDVDHALVLLVQAMAAVDAVHVVHL